MEKCYASNSPELEWKVASKSSTERSHKHCSFSGLIDIVLGGPVYDEACCCIPKDTLKFFTAKRKCHRKPEHRPTRCSPNLHGSYDRYCRGRSAMLGNRSDCAFTFANTCLSYITLLHIIYRCTKQTSIFGRVLHNSLFSNVI